MASTRLVRLMGVSLSLTAATALASKRAYAEGPSAPTRRTYSMVAMDMDGTLLSPSHKLTDSTVSFLRELSHRGVIIALATGRSGPAVYEHVRHLGLPKPLPVVCYNGASCRLFPATPSNPAHEQDIVFERPLGEAAVSEILSLADELGVVAQYYVGDQIFVPCRTPEHESLIRRYAELTGARHTIIDDYQEARAAGPPAKILLMTDDPDKVAAAARARLKELGSTPAFNVIRGSPPFFVEFLNSEVCKGRGLEELCKRLDVPIEDVVAFGDGDNDLEFLQVSGLGIAMLNGREVVKAAADKVSDKTNAEEGVLHELQKLANEEALLPRK